ncbi:hypothetical protein VTO58DRAFT_105168 [Aureobasidium pullulans]|nr:hypothetical protein JADG_000189 [Aureobasidium pullulans]
MTANMANLADPHDSPMTSDRSQRVKTVYLSGPIKILLPLNECEEVESSGREQPELDADMPLSSASVGAKNEKIVYLSGPIRIIVPWEDSDEIDSTKLAPNTDMTTNLTALTEETVSEVRKFDCNHPDDTLSPFCPYLPGNEILLKTSEDGAPIKAVILKYFPATLSCCMVIRFVEPHIVNNTSECVLKLYDRRFSTQHREDWDAAPWAPELEKEYQDFVSCGDAEEFFSYWDAEKECDDNWSAAYINNSDRWSPAKREAYLQWESTMTYEIEKKAYENMAELQGKDVPKVFGEIVLNEPFIASKENTSDENNEDDDEDVEEDSAEADRNPHTINIPGILIQYINGFHLTDLHEHWPNEHWQSIVDSAIEKLHHVQECGILNRDLNTRNFQVDPQTHNVMMIDFGMVSFREDAEDERQWESAQACQDEEGAVGLLMQNYLKERGGGSITYKPSERVLRLRYRFNDIDGEREGGTAEEDEYVKKHKDFVFRK